MKFLGKKVFLTILISFSSTLAAKVVIFSGIPANWQKQVTERFLEKHGLNSSAFISWDSQNKECKKIKGSVLQLCFRDQKVFLVTAKPEILRSTFAQIIGPNELEIRHKPKKPSKGRPL